MAITFCTVTGKSFFQVHLHLDVLEKFIVLSTIASSLSAEEKKKKEEEEKKESLDYMAEWSLRVPVSASQAVIIAKDGEIFVEKLENSTEHVSRITQTKIKSTFVIFTK